jgi:hypothetical protein
MTDISGTGIKYGKTLEERKAYFREYYQLNKERCLARRVLCYQKHNPPESKQHRKPRKTIIELPPTYKEKLSKEEQLTGKTA